MGPADRLEVAGDGSPDDEADAIGQVFGGEPGALTESLLAEVEESGLTEAGGPVLLEHQVVDLAAMEGEAGGLLVRLR